MLKRNVRIWVRLNEEEFAVLQKRLKQCNYSREAYIRSLIIGYIPKEKPDDRFYTAMRDLHGIANNINQLARKAAVLGFIDVPFYKREAEKWSAFQLEIRRKFLMPDRIE